MSINAIGKDCDNIDDATAPRDLAEEQCIRASVAVNDIEASGYLLRCGPTAGSDLDPVHVTCVAADQSGCQSWTVNSGDHLYCALFRLVKTKLVQYGDPYDVPFTATVVRPQ